MRHYDIYRYLLKLSVSELLDEKEKFNKKLINTFMLGYPKMVQNVINYKLGAPIARLELERIEISAAYGENKEITNIIEAKNMVNMIMVVSCIFMLLLLIANQYFKWFSNTGGELAYTAIGVFICYVYIQRMLKLRIMRIMESGNSFRPLKNEEY